MAVINTAEGIQKDFQKNMLTRMKESTGGQLMDLGENRTLDGTESTFFNRLSGGKAVTTAPNLYGGNATDGTGGEVGAVEVKPSFAYAYQKISDETVNTTTVDYKGAIPNELVRQLDVNSDAKVLKALKDADSEINKVGVLSTALEDQLKLLIGTAKGAILDAEVTPDKRKLVKLIMNKATAKKLLALDIAINNDYVQLSGAGAEAKPMFYGCEMVIVKATDANLPNGVMYFVPSMTVGFAMWKGGDKAESKYELGNQDTWMFSAKKSLGVGVIEPESIAKFSCKIA